MSPGVFAPLPSACNYAKPAAPGRRFGGTEMADHGQVEYATATGNDYPAHEETYRNFLSLAKGILVVVIIILIGMATFLTGS
jgi:hypothetical protein